MTKIMLSRVQMADMGLLRWVHSVTFRDKSAQLWNWYRPESPATSRNREISATLVRPCAQNIPRGIGEERPSGSTHGQGAHRSSKARVEWLHLRPCLVPSYCGASRTIWDSCWPWRISRPPTVHATLLRGKADMKMNAFHRHKHFSDFMQKLDLRQISCWP